MKAKQKNVTIVVPVYADWSSLSQCIQSLKTHVTGEHKVIIVNDSGPEVEQLEKNILTAIAHNKNFEYYRNDTNLGFVKTCNRAVYELDTTKNDILLLNSDTIVTAGFLEEMQSVLYLSEKHGTVCPRSNNATIASVPFLNMDNTSDRSLDYSMSVYENIKNMLPRYQVTPVVIGFCMLIRRSLIDDFGLFDEAYRLGYGEECDFCQRINTYGFSSVIANQAYVFHLESRSFTSEKKAMLMAKNNKILLSRYPYYDDSVQRYIVRGMDPVDWFADMIGGTRAKIKVLIDLWQLPHVYGSTSRNALALLLFLKNNMGAYGDVEFTVLADRHTAKQLDLARFCMRILHPDNIKELFHVGYSVSQIHNLDHLQLINRYCYRMVFSLLDIATIRSYKLLSHNVEQKSAFADAMQYADRIIAASDFTQEDTEQYFAQAAHWDKEKIVTVYQGVSETGIASTSRIQVGHAIQERMSAGDYLLVLGNEQPFKLISESVKALAENHKLIVLGSSRSSTLQNVLYLGWGDTNETLIEQLRQNAKAIVFPSLYEGFGLPIVDAARSGTAVVIYRSKVGAEVSRLAGKGVVIEYFDSLRDLPAAVEKALKRSPKPSTPRHSDDHNREVVELLIAAARDTSVNPEALRERWYYFSRLADYLEVLRSRPSYKNRSSIIALTAQTLKNRWPSLYYVARNQYRMITKKDQ